MPRSRAPQQSRGRLQASFEKTAKRSTEQKNGRKCDLATALLPKGDTRATNAKTEYQGFSGIASTFFMAICSGKKEGEPARVPFKPMCSTSRSRLTLPAGSMKHHSL